MELSAVQQRVLGSLIEKELLTPDAYPLSMNALVAACNQSTSRNPVMDLSETAVSTALENLRADGLARVVYSKGARVDRYKHVADEHWALERPAIAVLGLLLLRGPQTTAELRTRSARMHEFSTHDEVEAVLGALADRDEALVRRGDRQPGQKEARWSLCVGAASAPPEARQATLHMLRPLPDADRDEAGSDEVDYEDFALAPSSGTHPGEIEALRARIAQLEAAMADLRADHSALVERLRDLFS